jgi:hypothetical protein
MDVVGIISRWGDETGPVPEIVGAQYFGFRIY